MVGNYYSVSQKPLLIEKLKYKIITNAEQCLSSWNERKIELQMPIVATSAQLLAIPMLAEVYKLRLRPFFYLDSVYQMYYKQMLNRLDSVEHSGLNWIPLILFDLRVKVFC